MKKLFGTDGIRGEFNEHPMTLDVAYRVGRAVSQVFAGDGTCQKIAVGRDTRESGPVIEEAIVEGVVSTGADALLLGVLPTPGTSFITRDVSACAGIMVSASHNPYQDNGIKIFSSDGFKLPDEREGKIEECVFSGEICRGLGKKGRVSRLCDAGERYKGFLGKSLGEAGTLEGLKVGLDCANGATYRVGPELFTELGASVESLFVEPDGRNINDGCGSQHPQKLSELVVERGLDAGLAFDGDGDRLIAVDEKGSVLTGDQIIAICAKVLKDEGRLKNNLVVTTVMSNIGLGLALKELGVRHYMADVGDRYVLERMLSEGACIGGEDSGHIIFLDYHNTGDGLLTALQLLRAFIREGRPLSELAGLMRVYPQTLINVTVKDKPDIKTVPGIMAAISEVEEELGGKGRVLVRYSGTQPMLRVMVEGPTQEETDEFCKRIAGVVEENLS